ncbi:esterase/lipase family protein [Streptomyces caatingaensis]|uniref:Lipase n=1 Tax=Streptomyces caatingaensis TaxID=1678637 RepID=A0A0K9XBE3_9ACTN|nr:lipase [Streptomyces caatingaensis]
MRGTLAAVLAGLLGATAVPAGGVAAAPAPDPVVLVHGRNAGPGVWNTMTDRLAAAGYPRDRLFAWSYDTAASTNETLAARLSDHVDTVLARTGASRVDLVAHSLGSLPTRWYVKFGDGGRKVAHWASLAGPNHGTGVARLCALWDQGCRDMTPGSYVLTRLNEGSETPAPVAYATWWSSCDEQVDPVSSPRLAGAVNTETGCLRHNDLLSDPVVARQVRDFLAR